ncbi:MAG TPA: hypothetical protein VES73_09105 [Lamprocystis sp. (in: g-proteobacteria)]|nr:hypothetical protein [Lamprocystis sp. (in: g-proteobacteria)]
MVLVGYRDQCKTFTELTWIECKDQVQWQPGLPGFGCCRFQWRPLFLRE